MDHTLTKTYDELDEMVLAQRLAGAIRFPTISYVDYTRFFLDLIQSSCEATT